MKFPHRITYTLPSDAPAATIIGSLEIDGPELTVDPFAPVVALRRATLLDRLNRPDEAITLLRDLSRERAEALRRAEAYRLAFDAVQIGHGRFDAVFIAGDEHEQDHNLSKAKRLLGWEPRTHLQLGQ